MSELVKKLQERRSLFWLLPICVFAWLVYTMVMLFPGSPTNDSLGQLLQVQTGCIDNWKPALYAYLLQFGEWLFPGSSLSFAFVVQIIFFAGGFFLVILHLGRKRRIFYLLSPIVFCMAQKGVSVVEVGNDAMAAACYMVFVGSVLNLRDMANSCLKWSLFSISLMVLGYGMILRHNAVFAVLVLLCWAFFSLTGSRKKAVAAALASVVFFFAVNALVLDVFAKVEKSYPLKSPFADDLVNISILNNTWDEFCVSRQQEQSMLLGKPAEVCKLCADVCNFYPSGLNPYGRIVSPDERREDYEQYRKAWLRAVKESPKQYVFLKAYFFQQFLLAGRSLPWVEDIVQTCYPHVTTTVRGVCRDWTSWVNRLVLFNAVLPFAVYGLLIVSLLVRVWKRIPFTQGMTDVVCLSLSAVCYTGTFVIFTLSSSEERYYIIPASMALVTLLLFFAERVVHKFDAKTIQTNSGV